MKKIVILAIPLLILLSFSSCMFTNESNTFEGRDTIVSFCEGRFALLKGWLPKSNNIPEGKVDYNDFQLQITLYDRLNSESISEDVTNYLIVEETNTAYILCKNEYIKINLKNEKIENYSFKVELNENDKAIFNSLSTTTIIN